MTERDESHSSVEEQAKLGWHAASELLKPFGPVAANFTEAIRTLVGGFERGSTLSNGAQNHIIRLLKNNTVKATYFFFTKQFRPEMLEGKTYVSEKDLFAAYTAVDHAAIISLCYLFKTLSRKIDKEEWEYVQTPLYEALAIGASVGQKIPEVGLGIGLLSSGIRYLALAPLLRENRRAFKEYRQHLKAKDLAFDNQVEERLWQCTSTQVAAIMLERMGFPRAAGLQYVAASERDESVQPDAIFGTPIRIADCLTDAYIEGSEIPTTLPSWVGKKVDLHAEMRGNLLAALNKTLSDKNRIEWLNKGSSSIDPTSTPELFSEAERLAFAENPDASPKP